MLDLGCGQGDLLAYLMQTKGVAAVGVDLEFSRITACVRRGVSAYQGDMTTLMRVFPERHFDRVIDVKVFLSVDKLAQKAEVSIHVPGRDIFAESTDQDLYAAIDSLAGVIKSNREQRRSAAEALSNSGVDKYDIPAFLRRQAD